VGEAQEGTLIRVEGYVKQTRGDPPYGYKAFIDDSSGECQIFVNVSTGLVDSARDWKVGDFISVIGIVGQYGNTYEVMPRILSDIRMQARK
jgi:DNA/RNA endonuclease YhcR with UshA esterase domain